MRILAGDLRGRKLKSPKHGHVRPISARIKKSLFDILAGFLPNAKFLDLFAGSGAVGIEALSRGAQFVCFVDLSPRCVESLRRTLEAMGLSGKAKAAVGDVLKDLSWVPFRSGCGEFNLVFLGPPYKDEEKRPLAYSSLALRRLSEARLLAPAGLVICQHHVKENVSPPESFELFRREKYGDTYLSFFRENRASPQA